MNGWVLGPVNPRFAHLYETEPEIMTVIQMRQAYDDQKAIETTNRSFGPPLWAQLHIRSLLVPMGFDDSAWLEAFSTRVPCGTCRNHWMEMIERAPPAWGVGFDYFAWTVDRHNEVRSRLNQPEMLLVSARLQWSGMLPARLPSIPEI